MAVTSTGSVGGASYFARYQNLGRQHEFFFLFAHHWFDSHKQKTPDCRLSMPVGADRGLGSASSRNAVSNELKAHGALLES